MAHCCFQCLSFSKVKLLVKVAFFVAICLSSSIILMFSASHFSPSASKVRDSDPSPYVTITWNEKKALVPSWTSSRPVSTSSAITDSTRRMQKLYWTSVHGKNDSEAYHFMSAYLDDRSEAHGRPAVVVVGYFSRIARPTKLYCALKYSTGKRICLKKEATQTQANCDSVVDMKKSKPMLYLCHLGKIKLSKDLSKDLPRAVVISNVSNCDQRFSSGEIPIENLEYVGGKLPTRKKFGVFIGGPLIQKKNMIHDLRQFIQMSQLLGAELFTMYISPGQVDSSVIQFLLDTYPSLVRLIEWKKFEIHHPLHYYGQLVLISDCLYRSMHEVDYLVMLDFDEIILPVKHKNWSELVEHLEKKGKYSSYSFLNRFFVGDTNRSTQLTTNSRALSNGSNLPVAKYFKTETVPVYFTRVQEVKCYFNYGAKTKLIIKPRHLVRGTVHESCESIKGYTNTYKVPPEDGISAHYRENRIPDCINKPTLTNNVAMKFARPFAERFHD